MNQIPSMKEKLELLQRLTECMEKRFGEHVDVNRQILETIAYVYTNETYASNAEFKLKLEQAFLLGLKSNTAPLRQTFFRLFNRNFNSNDLYERLCYIIVTQNWELFGAHYWIKQCIQLTLGACTEPHEKLTYSDLCPATNGFHINGLTTLAVASKPEPQSQSEPEPEAERDDDMIEFHELDKHFVANLELTTTETFDHVKFLNKPFMSIYESGDDTMITDNGPESERRKLLTKLLDSQTRLFAFVKSAVKCANLVSSMCQLCHLNGELAHDVWVQSFVQMFNLLSSKQQQNLYGEMTPFIASGSHCVQKQLPLSTLHTFVESFSRAKPSTALFVRPSLLTYLAKNHNLWHRAILLLEGSMTETNELHLFPQSAVAMQGVQHETFAGLSQLFATLREDDYRAGLWHRKATYDITKLALVYEQQGIYNQAQKLYEEMIAKSAEHHLNEPTINQPDVLLEFNLWEEKWIKCCKELNQWNELHEYASGKHNDLCLSLECAWKVQQQQQQPDWQAMKAIILAQKESSLPKDQAWRWILYQGYNLVCNPDEATQTLGFTGSGSFAAVESKVERCMIMALKEWRRLPHLVSPAHMTLLQAAQQIVELQEAFQIQSNLLTLEQLAAQQQQQGALAHPISVVQEIKGSFFIIKLKS